MPARTSTVPATIHPVNGSPRMTMPMAIVDSGPIAADINNDYVKEILADFNDWREVKRPTRGFGWVGLNAGIEDWTSFNDAP